MSKVISPIMTDGTGMAIAQAINHATAVNLALNTASYDADGTLLEVQDARTVNETQYASLGEAIRAEVTRIDNEKEVQAEALEGHADRITAVENKANTNTTNIAKLNDSVNAINTSGLSSIKVIFNSDFETVANGVPLNNKLTCRMSGNGSSAVSGLPSQAMYLVEIYAISEATAFALAYAVESGNMFYKRKSAGTWGGWEKKTNTIS